MTKRMIVMILLVLLVASGIGYYKYSKMQGMMAQMQAMGSILPVVSATTATSEEWQQSMTAVGSIRAVRGVDIAAEIAGVVEKIHFDSGTDVKAGASLVTLKNDEDTARLRALEARVKLAQTTLERNRKQFAAQAVAQATIDASEAELSTTRAALAEQRALLEKKTIRAPFSGNLGIRHVDIGQYLTPGTVIVTLQQLDPVYMDFFVPQQQLAHLREGQTISVKNDTYPDRTFEGKILAINTKVEQDTRNVQVRAELPNPDKALLPGMYANAAIRYGKPQHLVTLPQTAITYNPYGNTVFVLKEEKKEGEEQAKLVAHQVFVTLGETRGDQVAVLKGVENGDQVVTSGQIKLQNGAAVKVDNSVMPKNDVSPTVKDQ